MGKNKQLLINMITSFIIFAINLGIGFFLTSYIVKTVGSEAYGFVTLANSMVNYATIITIALNSVAGRFISIKMHQGDKAEANQYFTSVFLSNVTLSIILIALGIPFVWKLENIINIPFELIITVKLLFSLILVNFIISILSTVFTIATFITNKLHLSNIVNCISSVLRIFLLIGFLGFISPNVAFIGLVSCICSLVTVFANIILTKKLVPSLQIRKSYFNIKLILQLLSSGIWNTVTKLAQILSDGLDLLISNLWVSTVAMGQLSIAKVIPGLMGSLISIVVSVFSPQLTIYYAQNNMAALVKELKLSMKMTSFFSNIPFCIFVVLGGFFFGLWVPSQDSEVLHLLSILCIQAVVVSGAVTGLNNVFLITNHLKINSIFWIIVSIFDILLVAILLKTTELGIYAIAGVSTSVGIFANLAFVPLYACRCLGIKWSTFYPQIFRYMGTTFIMLAVLYLLKQIINVPYTWFGFFIIVFINLIVGGFVNCVILLNSSERKYLINKINEKVLRR